MYIFDRVPYMFLTWSFYNDLRIFVSTWNVGGVAPDEGVKMEDLLETCNNSCDIYVLGYEWIEVDFRIV